MHYEPDFQVLIPNGIKIPFLFNTWTFLKYCQQKNIELKSLIREASNGKAFKGNDLLILLKIASESFIKFNNEELTYHETEAFAFLNQMKKHDSFKEEDQIIKVFLLKLFNLSNFSKE